MKEITTLEELRKAAENKKAVCADENGKNRKPAAFVINMSAAVIIRMYPKMFIYEKQEKTQ